MLIDIAVVCLQRVHAAQWPDDAKLDSLWMSWASQWRQLRMH